MNRKHLRTLRAINAHPVSANIRWRDIDTLLDKIRSVTAEEVQAVAKKYFGDATLTAAVLDPQPLPEGAPQKSAATTRH